MRVHGLYRCVDTSGVAITETAIVIDAGLPPQ
jgi:hypothetical protein